MNRTTDPTVFVVSDSAGETGESVVKAAAAQFFPAAIDIRRIPYVNDRRDLDAVLETALQAQAIVVYTLVVPELREYLIEQAFMRGVKSIDVLGPVIGSLETMLDKQARHEPGMNHLLNEEYFRKVAAVEFAVKYDDGRDPSGILKADIVLIGVSRTSKTPLSMYLAHKTYKVANVPLVPELQPPAELFTVHPSKVVGLTIGTEKLNMIRKERLLSLGLGADASYADVNRIERELLHAKQVMERIGCFVVDVSNKAVEETASLIMER